VALLLSALLRIYRLPEITDLEHEVAIGGKGFLNDVAGKHELFSKDVFFYPYPPIHHGHHYNLTYATLSMLNYE